MAGLVVIDFIDMEQSSHVRKVEKAMKDALKNDRARIQVGRISSFGLMEMSRQRLRTGVLEASTKACPHCEGTGLMRTASSSGLSALRIIEEEAARGRGEKILLRAGREAAIYLLNKKRSELAEIESRYGVTVEVIIDEAFEGARMSVESTGPRPVAPQRQISAPVIDQDDEDEVDYAAEAEEEDEDDRAPAEARDRNRDEEGEGGPRRRRRRRGGRGRNRQREGGEVEGDRGERPAESEDGEPAIDQADAPVRRDEDESEGSSRGRRGRRGGRGRRGRGDGETVATDEAPMVEPVIADEAPLADAEPAGEDAKPKTRRRPKARQAAEDLGVASAPVVEQAAEPDAVEKPKRRSRAKKADAQVIAEEVPVEPVTAEEVPAEPAIVEPEAKAPAKSKAKAASKAKPKAPVPADNDAVTADVDENGEPLRGGWWQRTFG